MGGGRELPSRVGESIRIPKHSPAQAAAFQVALAHLALHGPSSCAGEREEKLVTSVVFSARQSCSTTYEC